MPQDPGFNLADMILSQHCCSEASRSCIRPCLSTAVTAHVSFPARASLDLLQQLQGFVPFPGLQVGRKASHLGGTKNFGCHLRCVRGDRGRRAAGRGQQPNGDGEVWRLVHCSEKEQGSLGDSCPIFSIGSRGPLQPSQSSPSWHTEAL